MLFVHQSNELYGSDLVFLESVRAAKSAFPGARIDVVLPYYGPLADRLCLYCDNIIYEPIFVLRKSRCKSISGLLNFFLLPLRIISAYNRIKKYNLVYINTVVVLDYILACFFSKTVTCIHVHEILSKRIAFLFGYILKCCANIIIFNSYATKCAFPQYLSNKSYVIWNGTVCSSVKCVEAANSSFPLKILMPGRINSWKGQDFLIKSLATLSGEYKNKYEVRIIGDTFCGQEHYRDRLMKLIRDYDMETQIKLLGFSSDMDSQYKWADVVVVPSLKPEPFGLVAIEAMSYCRPVIAAAHGGLVEIVGENEGGWLFEPGNTSAFNDLIIALIRDRSLLMQKSMGAHLRVCKFFSIEVYKHNIISLLKQILPL